MTEQFSSQIAELVRERQRREVTLAQLADSADVDIEILMSVERSGVGAPLGHLRAYAEALGYDVGLIVTAESHIAQRTNVRCDTCGGGATFHPQLHLTLLNHCVDVGLTELIKALHSCGIRVSGGCQGFIDGRRGGEAHVVLPTLADARVFYALVDRATTTMTNRAGLRGHHVGGGSWSSAVRWDVLPGELLADATCVVRFPASDLAELTDLAANPPKPALGDLAYRAPSKFRTYD